MLIKAEVSQEEKIKTSPSETTDRKIIEINIRQKEKYMFFKKKQKS
jgi:hypothetical protein